MSYLPVNGEHKEVCYGGNKENVIDGDVGTTEGDCVAKVQVVVGLLQLDWNDEESNEQITHSQ